MKYLLILGCIVFSASQLLAQQPNAEDSLHFDSSEVVSKTFIGGYGNAFYQRNFETDFSTIRLERFVLFVGHRFNQKISLFSELEVEDAKISGGEPGGEIALEQVYLKFNLNENHYVVAGLFLPRFGILNEDHLPTAFYGNERNRVETYVIPATWRELGVGYYGRPANLPISYSLALINGLSSAGFEQGSGIREGRFEGRDATANNLAVTGSVQLYQGNLKTQVSGYFGGSAGVRARTADSLQLESGLFGSPVMLGEADLQYEKKGFTAKVLGTVVSIPDASDINRAYANNTAELEYGAYGELGYNIFQRYKKLKSKQLIAFVRYEKMNLNASIPENGIIDDAQDQQHFVTGLNYLPNPNVVIKADARFTHTGAKNPELVINPNPSAPAYLTDQTFFNLGIGYSF